MHFAHGFCAWVLRNALRALAVCTLPALAQQADNQKKSVGLNAPLFFNLCTISNGAVGAYSFSNASIPRGPPYGNNKWENVM